MRRILCLLLFTPTLFGQSDPRTGSLTTLDGTFPFEPPASAEAWRARRARVQRQVLVAAGLWPGIVRWEGRPVIHGRVDRDGYSVEKISFESLPGFQVTGNLYRPTGREGPFPGVLSPHGHWADGRFCEVPEEDVQGQIARGEETFLSNGRYHLQARCAQLARMGCVVLQHDMVGYADSRQLSHWGEFQDVEAELWAINLFGLQTRNSISSLDVLLGLDDVDSERIAVVGASGGGTQTFALGAVDDRPDVLFPAVMVSTSMQGGCVCENASHLRVGLGNVELAALAAPRPLGLTGADDWTKEIMTKGLPELRSLYATLGEPDRVAAWCYPDFPHNFNAVSRAHMAQWLHQHLSLPGAVPAEETPLEPIAPQELSVYDDEHPRPTGGADMVREALRAIALGERARLAQGLVRDPVAGWADYRRIVGGALGVLLHADRPLAAKRAYAAGTWTFRRPDAVVRLDMRSREDSLGVLVAGPVEAELTAALGDSVGVGVIQPFAEDLPTAHRSGHALFTWGYNPTHLAHRVHDLRTVLASMGEGTVPALLGRGDESLAALLAAALDPGAVRCVAVDFTRGLDAVDSHDHRDFLPGAERWGGLAGYAALIAPTPLCLLGVEEVPAVVRDAYRAAGATDAVTAVADPAAMDLRDWLMETGSNARLKDGSGGRF